MTRGSHSPEIFSRFLEFLLRLDDSSWRAFFVEINYTPELLLASRNKTTRAITTCDGLSLQFVRRVILKAMNEKVSLRSGKAVARLKRKNVSTRSVLKDANLRMADCEHWRNTVRTK